MPVTPRLCAILAMDAYNRGNIPAVDIDNSAQVGSASVLLTRADTESGFFAVAYRVGEEVVISYRGTDVRPFSEFAKDAENWAGGIGWETAQAKAAAAFYQDVVATYGDNVTLTGHSLGGGLAGLMASLYHKPAVVFDNMAFALCAENVYFNATNPTLTIAGGGVVPNPSYQSTLDTYYNAFVPQQPNQSLVIGLQVDGQILQLLLNSTGNPLFAGTSALDPLDLHSMSLLEVLLHATLSNNGSENPEWVLLKEALVLSLFNDKIAEAAGIGSVLGSSDDADKMRAMIAYTAIEDGPSPFGNVAIRSLFNDTGDISHLADTNDDLTLKLLGNFVEISTQYSALRAIDKSTVPEFAAGAASWDATSVTMGLTLARGGVNNDGRVIGLENALSNVITATTGIPSFGDSLSALGEYFGTFTETLLSGLSMIKATATSMTSLDGSSAEKGAFLIGLKNSGQNSFKGGDEGTNVMFASGMENVFDLSKGNNIVLLTDAGTATLDTSMHGDPLHSINWNMVQGTEGEDSFNFVGPELAPLTIVYGGNSADTFDFEVAEGQGASVYMLQMDDLNAQNFLSLDPQKIADYIAEGDGNSYGGGVNKIVIINPDATDILKYNQEIISEPTRYKVSESELHYKVAYDETNVPYSIDLSNFFKMVGPATDDNRNMFADGWEEYDDFYETYSLKSGNTDIKVPIWWSVGSQFGNGLFLNRIESADGTPQTEQFDMQGGYGSFEAVVGSGSTTSTTYYSEVDAGTTRSDYQFVKGLYIVGFNDGDFGINLQANNDYGSVWNTHRLERQVTEWLSGTIDFDTWASNDGSASGNNARWRIYGRDPKTFGETFSDESDNQENYGHDYYIVDETAFSEEMERPKLSIADFKRDQPTSPPNNMRTSQDQFAASSADTDNRSADSNDTLPAVGQATVAAAWKSEDERVAELKERGLDADGNPVTDFGGLGRVFGASQDNIPDIAYRHLNRFAARQNSNEQHFAGVGELRAMPEAGIRLLNLLFDKEEIKLFADAIPGTSSLQMADGTNRLVSDPTLAFRPSMSSAA